MSEENVDLFRAGIEAMNRRDIEGVFQGMDPEIRFEHRLAALQGRFVGLDGVRDWFADLAEHFDTWRIDCEDIRDLGDRVLALGTVHTTGKEKWSRDRAALHGRSPVQEWVDDRLHRLRRQGSRPRNRRAVGVGDVAGERRGCAVPTG